MLGFHPVMSTAHARIQSVWISALIGVGCIALGVAFLRLDLTVRAPGVVRAATESRLYAPADATVAGHHVQLGQDVKPGDLLLELDDTDLRLRAVQLERERTETQSALDRNRIALREIVVKPASAEMLTADERRTRLARISAIQQEIEQNYASGRDLQIISELELRRQEIEKLRAELDLLQADILAEWQKAGVPAFEQERLQVEERRLEALLELNRREHELVEARRATLRLAAPCTGRVVAINVRFSGMGVRKGDELLKIASLDGHYMVETHVPERNVDLLRPGTRAIMESGVFDSMLEGRAHGTVTRISPEGAESAAAAAPTARSYEVQVAVEDTPYPLVLGSRVEVILTLGKRPLYEVFFRSAHALRGREPSSEPATP